MTCELLWHPKALKEWRKLGDSIRLPLKDKLIRRLEEPRNPKAALHGLKDYYKIKHESFRLIYRVLDDETAIEVLAVGARDKLIAYKSAEDRLE